MKKVYAIVTPELSSAQKAVQSSHALVELMLSFPELKEKESWGHGSLVLLKAESREEFLFLYEMIKISCPIFSEFSEPFYQNKLTAFSFLETDVSKNITKKLKLMIKEETVEEKVIKINESFSLA